MNLRKQCEIKKWNINKHNTAEKQHQRCNISDRRQKQAVVGVNKHCAIRF